MVKNLPVMQEGDPGSVSGLGRPPGEGNGNPFQYFLKNPMDTGAWWTTVRGVEESDVTE